MKIGLLVPEMPPDTIGGGGAVFEALAKQLHLHGHKVTVVTSRTFGAIIPATSPLPFPVFRLDELPHPAPAYRTYMPPFSPTQILSAISLLRRCDVINVHGYGHPLIDVLSLGLDARRIVFTLHGFLYTIPALGGPLAAAYASYDSVLGARVFRKAAKVTAVSSAVKALAMQRGRSDVTVIPNGFAPPIATAPLSSEIQTEISKGPFVLAVGRVEWLKGFDTLIRAMRLLKDQGISLRLLIAGRDNGYERELHRLAAGLQIEADISFLGFVPFNALSHLYSASKAYVLSSRTEAFPAAPLEAMSCSVPTVLSRVGGVVDMAENGIDSLLVTPEDPNAFAEGLRTLMSSEDLQTRIIKNGNARVARFLWDRVAISYEHLFRDLAC